MTVGDVFGLIVRLAGLLMGVFGVFDFFHAVLAWAGFPAMSRYPAPVDAAAAVVWLVLGIGFVLGAPAITRFAYRTP